MDRSLIFISLLTITKSLDIKQYYYNSTKVPWHEALEHCRRYYQDLASVESESEQKALETAAGLNSLSGLFGLYLDGHHWRWSEGVYATYTNWNQGEPNNTGSANQDIAVMVTDIGGWNDVWATVALPFYCMAPPTVEKVEMNWEEAMEHCRDSGRDLFSLRSETELAWIRDLMMGQGHHRIWMGLRFLGGGWMWVNGDPLGFQAWSEEEKDLQCPQLGRCGAVRAEGPWETVDCREKLLFMCN